MVEAQAYAAVSYRLRRVFEIRFGESDVVAFSCIFSACCVLSVLKLLALRWCYITNFFNIHDLAVCQERALLPWLVQIEISVFYDHHSIKRLIFLAFSESS